jgi:CelD/BcsL family acetyltransferase involved in cellulose biosynthesis
VKIVLVSPGELGGAEVAVWQAMQRATPILGNPFLSPEFAAAAGRYRPNARVALLMDGPSIMGFFPFEKRSFGVGVPIGGWVTPCHGVVHAPGVEWSPRQLLRGCQLSAWQFDNLVAYQRPYQTALVSTPMIDLADGFAAYRKELWEKSPRFCRELARKGRKLAREVGDVRLVTDTRDTSLLRTLMGWKSQQYRRTGCVDRFEFPWVTGLVDDLLASRGEHVSGLLTVLYAGEHPVAAQFGLRSGPLLVGWFTGFDVRFRKYSPGLLHLRMLAEELPAAGIDLIDMGKGSKSFVQIFKSHDSYVAEGILTSHSPLGRAHGVRNTATQWATRTIRQHPGLHDAADMLLRRTGASRVIYGRM